MPHRLSILAFGLTLAACAPEELSPLDQMRGDTVWPSAVATSQAPPPVTLDLTATPLLVGQSGTLRASQVAPNSRVFFVASLAQGGSPFCPPPLGGQPLRHRDSLRRARQRL